jgi:hypothetical protein
VLGAQVNNEGYTVGHECFPTGDAEAGERVRADEYPVGGFTPSREWQTTEVADIDAAVPGKDTAFLA